MILRTDQAIVNAYGSNRHVYAWEFWRLYELINDPWNFTSEENINSMRDYARVLDGAVDMAGVDVMIDFGCGVGVLAHVVKELFPSVKVVGLDFQIALDRGDRSFPPSPFDYKIGVQRNEDEAELLSPAKYEIAPLTGKRVLVNHLNSIYYLFNDKSEAEIENNLVVLNSLLFGLVPDAEERLTVIANSGFNYAPGNNAMFRSGLRKLTNTHLAISNQAAEFNANLNIRVWSSK